MRTACTKVPDRTGDGNTGPHLGALYDFDHHLYKFCRAGNSANFPWFVGGWSFSHRHACHRKLVHEMYVAFPTPSRNGELQANINFFSAEQALRAGVRTSLHHFKYP